MMPMRLERHRAPRRMPLWLVLLGLFAGLVLLWAVLLVLGCMQ